MTGIFAIRNQIIKLSHEYETWVQIIAKFIGMMFVFNYINSELGYFELLTGFSMNILLSLVCSIIPGSFCVLLVGAVVVAHMVKLSIVLGGLALVVMIIVYLLFLIFSPEQSAVILAIPVLMHFHLHFMIPVIIGIFLTPYAVIPATLGVFMVKFIGCEINAVSLTGEGMSIELDGVTEALSNILSQMTGDKEIWLYLVVAAVTVAVIYVIIQFSFDYAWYVAIVAGTIAGIIVSFLAEGILNSGTPVTGIIFSLILGAIISAGVQFFRCPLEYARKEYVQFEDEDYYYYVKAIPKYTSLEELPERKKTVKEAVKKTAK